MVMPDEWAEGKVRIKNLDSGEESTVDAGFVKIILHV